MDKGMCLDFFFSIDPGCIVIGENPVVLPKSLFRFSSNNLEKKIWTNFLDNPICSSICGMITFNETTLKTPLYVSLFIPV